MDAHNPDGMAQLGNYQSPGCTGRRILMCGDETAPTQEVVAAAGRGGLFDHFVTAVIRHCAAASREKFPS
jgi:hypothetical protein